MQITRNVISALFVAVSSLCSIIMVLAFVRISGLILFVCSVPIFAIPPLFIAAKIRQLRVRPLNVGIKALLFLAKCVSGAFVLYVLTWGFMVTLALSRVIYLNWVNEYALSDWMFYHTFVIDFTRQPLLLVLFWFISVAVHTIILVIEFAIKRANVDKFANQPLIPIDPL